MSHFLFFMCIYHSCQGKVQFEEEKVMKNMKNLNRELTMEELEGVIGGVEPEIDLVLDGQFDDRILEWMGNHQNLAEFRREMTMRRGPRRRVLANGIFREDSDWRSRVL